MRRKRTPFKGQFVAALCVAGFPVLSWCLSGSGVQQAWEGRMVLVLPPECKRPFQDLSAWLGIHLPKGEPKAGPPLTSALP